ncbi:hypothetical protein HCG51_08450 [Tolypothrix sp. PCC 7910]|uniref:hypothetical protein n=1 Tax=Tolypothrix sp. PCC 7910 TaxID=2099387 RepID=UPI0014278D19|nr:hypothetical protein [Tolypothrix sp. PCC 7910]QIR35271.1 hypothetical protein HCG51_08450 [Tolypothrix sp. PCC 7910]
MKRRNNIVASQKMERVPENQSSEQNLILHEARNPTPIWKKEHWQDGSSSWVSIGACEQLGEDNDRLDEAARVLESQS